ncbi:MAG: UDP-N-acetylmuramoyl-L-alanine--D-glutamate ligase [Limnochordia bacterium]|jgi:UDP-N-acetylmuramoylalanine--D-glutamate ligase
MNFSGGRIGVVGLGISNRALIKYLVAQGAQITACDRLTAAELGPTYGELASLGIDFRLGEDYLQGLTDFDLVFLTPGLPKNLPPIQNLLQKGIPVSSEIELFFSLCPAPIIGITGSSGKTTTTSLVGEFLAASGYSTYVGGNIGTPLIDRLEEITPEAKVVLELSSFQLELMNVSPSIAVVTNVTPNHLDVHPDMASYIEAKENIYRWQEGENLAIFNEDNEITRQMATWAPGRICTFSRQRNLECGAWLAEGDLMLCTGSIDDMICNQGELKLLGLHNVENVLAASLAAAEAGATLEAIRQVCRSFTGVAHRLEPVGTIDGVRYYNDSIATSPARAIAGLRSFRDPVILIAGGYDKQLPFEELAQEIVDRVKVLILLGDTAEKIAAAVNQHHHQVQIITVADLSEAVEAAHRSAQPGDVVLLSPACASYDMFRNFSERGDLFRDLVRQLEV